MGQFATGVTVASTRVGDETWGMTANAVMSLSLDPPLVLLAVARESQSHAKFQAGACFALNILSSQQQDLSDRFAFSGPKDFAGLEVKSAETGAPILLHCIGWVDCRLKEILTGGDHDMFVGEIVAGETGDGLPLVFYEGKYREIKTEDRRPKTEDS